MDFSDEVLLDSSFKAMDETPTDIRAIVQEGDEEGRGQNGEESTDTMDENTDQSNASLNVTANNNPRNSDNDDDYYFVLDSSPSKALQEGDELGQRQKKNSSENPEGEDDDDVADLKLQLNIERSDISSLNFYNSDDDGRQHAFDLNFPVNYDPEDRLKKSRVEDNNIRSSLRAGFSSEDHGLDLELRIGFSSARN